MPYLSVAGNRPGPAPGSRSRQLRQSLGDDAGALLEPQRHERWRTGTPPEKDEGPPRDRRGGGPKLEINTVYQRKPGG